MKRGTIFPILFIIIAAGVIGASLFLQNQPPLEVTIAVDPLAESWLRNAVVSFNQSETTLSNQRKIKVNLTVVSDLSVWRNSRDNLWTAGNHPHGWIPASSASLGYATAANIPMQENQPSLARTPLVWGGYASRVAVVTNEGTLPFDWERVLFAAETESWSALGGDTSWRFVKIAFSLPDSTIQGLGALYSATAAFSQNAAPMGDDVRNSYSALETLVNSVPNFNNIGSDIGQFLARGPSTVDLGIGPESQWLNNLSGIVSRESVQFSYPEYNFVLDFPLAIWNGAEITSDERAAVEAFGNWLMQPAQQSRIPAYGLRPANTNPQPTDSLFVNAQQYGIQLDWFSANIVQAPPQNDTQSLLSQFARFR